MDALHLLSGKVRRRLIQIQNFTRFRPGRGRVGWYLTTWSKNRRTGTVQALPASAARDLPHFDANEENDMAK